MRLARCPPSRVDRLVNTFIVQRGWVRVTEGTYIFFVYTDDFRYLLITYSIFLNIELGLLDSELLEKGRKKHT